MTRMRPVRWRRARRRDRGSSALELAIVAPTLLFVIFFTIQIALWLYGRNVALASAREGVSHLRLVQPTDNIADARAQVGTEVTHYARAVGGQTLLDPAVATTFDQRRERVTVTVTGRTMSLLPGMSLHVSRTAAGAIETFQADTNG